MIYVNRALVHCSWLGSASAMRTPLQRARAALRVGAASDRNTADWRPCRTTLSAPMIRAYSRSALPGSAALFRTAVALERERRLVSPHVAASVGSRPTGRVRHGGMGLTPSKLLIF